MKIALLHLYANVPNGGEHTYGIHLKQGLIQLGHLCDITVFSKSGKEIKNFQNKGFRVCPLDTIRDVMKEYDMIIFLSGILEGEQDYSFLKDLNIPICAIEHSAWGTWKRYNFPKLFSVTGNIPVFGNSITAVDIYKKVYKYDNCHAVRQPFAQELLKPVIEKITSDILRIVYPHRLSSNKKPELIYEFLNGIDNVNWEMSMYGNKGESIVRWAMLSELDETVISKHGKVFKNKRVTVLPVYEPMSDLPEVYSKADLTIHATRGKFDGGRFEYTLLESIFYNTPIMSDEKNWLRNLPVELIDGAWIEGKSYINMTKERLEQFATDLNFRKELLETSKEIVGRLFQAKNSAQQILDVTLNQ